MKVKCEISIGELIDKITILLIKSQKTQRQEVITELGKLMPIFYELGLQDINIYFKKLREINNCLWVIEDKIREKEDKQEFDAEFIDLARNVYIMNDERFRVKNLINTKYGSEVVEVKSYSHLREPE